MASFTRRTVGHLPLVIVGALVGAAAVFLWRSPSSPPAIWSGVLALAILANAVVAVVPLWHEDRRRERQATSRVCS